MMRLALSTFCAGLFACSSTSGHDAGAGGGAGGGGGVTSFNVSGHASVYPVAIDFLADAGRTDSVTGLTVRVEEPFKVATNSGGVFSVAVLDAAAAFSASNLSPDDIVLGVGAGIFDDGGTSDGGLRVIRSATTIYDVALNDGNKPAADIVNAKAYSIPTAFHDQLVKAITPAKIQMLTVGAPNGSVSTLIEAGCMMGRIVDAQGQPVAGVTVSPSPTSFTNSFFYPSADLTTTQSSTSSNGMFIYVHNGGDVNPFRFTVANRTEYKQRNAGATANACLILEVFPGLVAP